VGMPEDKRGAEGADTEDIPTDNCMQDCWNGMVVGEQSVEQVCESATGHHAGINPLACCDKLLPAAIQEEITRERSNENESLQK
jgi:hypothetical protein